MSTARFFFYVSILGCEAAGVPCVGDLDALCARAGAYCVPTFAAASDAGTYCGTKVTNARASINTCAGYRVATLTVDGATVWYYYDQDGGLVGAARRNNDYKPECLAGAKLFRLPNDCASSDDPHCCRYDFTKELACVPDAAATMSGVLDGG